MSIDRTFDAGLLTLTLNRPEKKNAVTRAMWCSLRQQITEATALGQPARAILLRATGSNFCAGADIGELMANRHDSAWMHANHTDVQAAMQVLYQCPVPTIALIEGSCFGGGFGLAAACDFRFATHAASFALTPAKLGLSYSLLDTRRIVALVGAARARELLLTGAPWSAAQALTFGVLHELHAANTVEDAIAKRVRTLLACSATAIAAIKANLLAIEAGQYQETAASHARFNAAFASADFAEGAAAFLEKRPARF